MICAHPDCERDTASRHSRYCEEHRGGRKMIDYSKCPATARLPLTRMFTDDERPVFQELCQQHRLSAQPPGVQEDLVHLFWMTIQIRRETEKIGRNDGDVSRANSLIKQHHAMTKDLGLLPGRGGEKLADPFGVGDFLTGDGSKAI